MSVWMSSRDAARVLGLDSHYVTTLVKTGKLAAISGGGNNNPYKFHPAEVERCRIARWQRKESANCPVCVCDAPTPDGIGECQQCRRPYRQETFAECRAAWRAHLGLSSSSHAVSAGRDGFTQPVLDDSARPGSRPPLASGRATPEGLS